MQMTSSGTPRVAPAAPGRLGYAIPAEALLPYLAELDKWRAERRQELDRIDAAALRSPDSSSYTNDITLAMAIWQSVTERWERLNLLWDGARADERAREEMSRVIWGSGPVPGAGPGPGGMGLSLVEATRLSDALTTSLRSRLAFDPVAADVAARLAAVRAGLQRCDQLMPSSSGDRNGKPDLESYRRRLDSLTKTASEGGDVLGPLQFLEADVARAERDLIVSSATHRELGRDFRSTLLRRAELSAEERRIRELAATCAAQVSPIPRLAVPDVESLGRVPQSRAELNAFRAKLDLVARALAMVRDAYAKPLADRDELRGRLMAFIAKTGSIKADQGSFATALAAAGERAQAVLDETPCPLPVARDCVQAYQYLLSAAEKSGAAEKRGTAQKPGSQG